MNVELLNKYKYIEPKTGKINKNNVNFHCKYTFITGRKSVELEYAKTEFFYMLAATSQTLILHRKDWGFLFYFVLYLFGNHMYTILIEYSSFKTFRLLFFSKFDWDSYIASITKIASQKNGALICSTKFLPSESLLVSINPPSDLIWNTVMKFRLVLLFAT